MFEMAAIAPSFVGVAVKWDQSRLDAALKARIAVGRRTPAQVVNTAAFWIAVNTKNDMPFTTQERIDTELNVAVPLVKMKSGRFSRDKRRVKKVFGAVGNLALNPKYAAVPLLALIIQARVGNPDAPFPLAQSPWKGVSRAIGAQRMLAMMRRIFAARHSSTHFLQIGWNPAIRILRPLAISKFRRGGPPTESSRFEVGDPNDKGSAIPAVETWNCFAMIENSIGTEGRNAVQVNAALWRHSLGPLQRAMDLEAKLMEQYTLAQMKPANDAFNAACR